MTETKTTKPAKSAKATKSPKAKTDAATKEKKVAPGKTAAAAKPKKTSALDAAAKVLAGSKEPLNTKQMIETMAAQKLWTSPGGKTPHATLYSAILREINERGKESRFVKKERGKFVAKG